jgi:pyrimidine operon attenuation protein / uracil phosphoribosyltransferase
MNLPDAEQLFAELVRRISSEMSDNTAFVGIHSGGVWVAQRLHDTLKPRLPLGHIDVSFYRDDFRQRGLSSGVKPSAIPFDVEGADMILVDDVLYTGRTARAAMNELFDYGRPGRVRLAALVDRGGRQLPISAQFVGGTVTVESNERIELRRSSAGRLSLALRQV